MAESRIGTIIRRTIAGRFTELNVVVFMALAVLVFYGSSNEGQASLFGSWMHNYVEEKAGVFNVISPRLSSSQLADMNSLLAVMGGDGSVSSPVPSTDAVTISESAILAPMPPDDDYINRIAVSRIGITEYTVQEGDLLSFIASDFGVSQQSIIWANNLKNADTMTPGQILRIPPVTGIIHTAKKGDTATSVAKKYGADAERIIAYNHLADDGTIGIGEEVIVPDGKMAAATTASIASVAKAVTSFLHLPDLGDYFKFPTFGFNWGRIHGRNGVDMANSCGTPVYAAADGTVTIADSTGYNGGFGKYIKISHPNGTETLYGHASKILVEVGQVVGKGDKIMLMGTTGRSTGCHLHFEVHGARNPLAKY